MYAGLNVIQDAEDRAIAVAFTDRMRYKAFIEAGEYFIAKHGLIIGGPSATRFLLGQPAPSIATFQYDLFSNRVAMHARELGDALFQLDPQGLSHYTTVLTKVADYLLTVMVDGRELFNLMYIPNHQGVRITEIITTTTRPAQFATDSSGAPLGILCASPEIQLIAIYAALCNPAKAAEWESLLAEESGLRALLGEKGNQVPDLACTLGGAARPSRFRQVLWDKYIPGPGRVLIGPAAIARLTEKKSALCGGRLQVITAGRLEGDAQEITALAKSAGAEVSWKINDPKIPMEHRIRRMTIYTVNAGRRDPILDIYNSACFDLVPYVASPGTGIKVGTPFVLMRYRLIDLWTIQFLVRMGAVHENFAQMQITEIWSSYTAVAAHYESVAKSCSPEAAADQLMPLAAYIGRLEEPGIALKRAAQASGKFYPPYFPASRARE